MSLLFTQQYVAAMCEAIDSMKLTARQKELARGIMRAAIEFANAKHGMHASQEAKAAALSTAERGEVR